MASDLIRERTGSPPYVTPYLDALDRLQERTIARPEQLTARSRALLDARFDTRPATADAAFSHGATALIAEHSHYFDGFALLMPLPLGTAVAARVARPGSGRLVSEGDDQGWTISGPNADDSDRPDWVRLTAGLCRRLLPPDSTIELAVVSTIPPSCLDAYLAALGLAIARAAQSLFALSHDRSEIRSIIKSVIETYTGYPFSIAHLAAADEGIPDQFKLVDTRTLEHLSVDAPARDVLGWGLVDLGTGTVPDVSFHQKMRERAEDAADLLRRRGFPALISLRDLEHKDLKAALALLPRRHRPAVRHLVTENRRVQKLVAAVRRRDWQMFGALLLMSHSSHQKDWGATNALIDAAVHETETMSIEGMYGAGVTGRGGCVLVTGQPFIIPRCLDRIQMTLHERFDVRPNVMLL